MLVNGEYVRMQRTQDFINNTDIFTDYKGHLNRMNLELIGDINELTSDMYYTRISYLFIQEKIKNIDEMHMFLPRIWDVIKSIKKQENFFINTKHRLKEIGIPDKQIYNVIKQDISRTQERITRLKTILHDPYCNSFWMCEYIKFFENRTLTDDVREFLEITNLMPKVSQEMLSKEELFSRFVEKYTEYIQRELADRAIFISENNLVTDYGKYNINIFNKHKDAIEAEKIAKQLAISDQKKKDIQDYLSYMKNSIENQSPINEASFNDITGLIIRGSGLAAHAGLNHATWSIVCCARIFKDGNVKYGYLSGIKVITSSLDKAKIFIHRDKDKTEQEILSYINEMKKKDIYKDMQYRLISFTS